MLGSIFDYLVTLLSQDNTATLFVIIGVGYFIGKIKIFGIKLNIAGVIVVGAFLGFISGGYISLSPDLAQMGILLSMYMLGIQVGPVFFSSLTSRSGSMTGAIMLTYIISVAFVLIIVYIPGITSHDMLGFYSGMYQSTVSFANSLDLFFKFDYPTERLVSSFSIAYIVSIIVSFIYVQRLVNSKQHLFMGEEKYLESISVSSSTVVTKFIRLRNSYILEQSMDAQAIMNRTGIIISSFERDGEVSEVEPHTIFKIDDTLMVIGSPDRVEVFATFSGEILKVRHGQRSKHLQYGLYFVSNKDAIGRPIYTYQLKTKYNCSILSIRRGDIEFVPTENTVLELGDRVNTVYHYTYTTDVGEFFGDSIEDLSEGDLSSITLGILIGIAVGVIPVVIPGSQTIAIGQSLGVLFLGLILGKIGKTGPITWTVPAPISISLRQFGIIIFLAVSSLNAGAGLVDINIGTALLLVVISTIGILSFFKVMTIIYRRIYKFTYLQIIGLLAGILGQPQLIKMNADFRSQYPAITYARMLPIFTMAKILTIQVFFFTML